MSPQQEAVMIPADLYEPIPIPVIVLSQSGQITNMNALARDLFGERSLSRLYPAVLRQPILIARIEQGLEGKVASPVRIVLTEAGHDVTYKAHVVPRGGPDGGVVISFLDVSHMEEAGQMRADFVANVSHELRTPLTALSGFIETLRGPARDDAAARERFLGIMEQETARMNRLVADLLSLSRVEDTERMRPTDPQSLIDLVQTTINGLGPQIEETGAKVIVKRDESDAYLVPGDRDQLAQVLANLIENGLKYGKKGGELRVILTRADKRPGLRGPVICVTVEDDGEGIAPHHIGRLTERFYRVDTHRSREMGGTGLGLAIVKHIVNRHRGRLRIESALGQGSRFIVCLPAQS